MFCWLALKLAADWLQPLQNWWCINIFLQCQRENLHFVDSVVLFLKLWVIDQLSLNVKCQGCWLVRIRCLLKWWFVHLFRVIIYTIFYLGQPKLYSLYFKCEKWWFKMMMGDQFRKVDQYSPKSSPRGARSPVVSRQDSTGTLKTTISLGKNPSIVHSGPFYLMKEPPGNCFIIRFCVDQIGLRPSIG